MPIEVATYRIQVHSGFTLDEAASIILYLSELGISHLYSSPILQATKGSTHGYDVLDHTRVNTELGGEAAFRRLSETLRKHDLGLLLDIVPNHMAIGGKDNAWWWDVLENGQASRYAPYFDVDWTPPESKLHHVVMVPILGDHYGRILDAGDIHVERHDGTFTVRYHEHSFPVSPRSLEFILTRAASRSASEELDFFADALGHLPSSRATDWASLRRRHRDKRILTAFVTRHLQEAPDAAAAVDHTLEEINQDPQALHALLERQNYRLAFWRAARQDLGYRRFFDINTLIGLRTEDEQVFADVHDRVFRWLKEGTVDGVRVDHPDGLLDPEQYLIRLRDRVPNGWIVVEKILMPEERMSASWPVCGTTGYDFMNQVMGLFIDRDGEEPLTRFYADFTGETRNFADILREKKLQVLREILGSDLNILTSMLLNICERHPRHRDYTRHDLHEALRELIADFPVYRTYVRPRAGQVTDHDQCVLARTLEIAQARRPDFDSALFGFIQDILLLKVTGDLEGDFVTRFQQVTGPVMAKGAEDTAFYCYHRFIALNEVGGDPGRFGNTVENFHAWCQHMQRHWPNTMLGTSTHDTKRSEDVRARLVTLSEMPTQWIDTVSRWADRHRRYWAGKTPDHNFEYFLYQTLVGAWPLEQERTLAYCDKAMREAKSRTSWTDPDTEYEETIRAFVRGLYGDDEFMTELGALVGTLEMYGHETSLAQTLIKLTAPGIPDLYQGTEIWNFSLVDPDNRRPVDYALRRRLLQDLTGLSPEEIWRRRQEGLPKLWVIRQTLRIRQARPHLFGAKGDYCPLYAQGEKCAHVLSFMRGGEVITIAPRLFFQLKDDWGETVIDLPEGRWRHEFDGRILGGGVCRLRDLCLTLPVALLCKVN